MKNKKIILSAIAMLLTLSGCGGTSSSSTATNSSSSSSLIQSTSSSSSVFEGYVDFLEAFSNTVNYGLKLNTTNYDRYLEFYLEDLYYFDIKKTGYVELDSDPGYIHEFTTKNIGTNVVDYEMVVYGRSTYSSNYKTLEANTLKAIIAENYRGFQKVDERTYSNNNIVFIRTIADYFQSKMYKYATEIIITVGKDGRLDDFKIIEDSAELVALKFNNPQKEDLLMYKNWVNSGSIINERIYDYKALVEEDDSLISVYEGEEIEFKATVIAKDHEGNIYVANRDDEMGHIGIKVVPNANSDSVEVKDIVTVKGKIKTKDYNPYIINGNIKDTNEDNKYTPYFDEDGLVDANGGGIYAAQLFYRYPFFNDSLYSTFAYVNNITTYNENSNTAVDLIFPSQLNGEEAFHMELSIPKELSKEKKEALYNEFKNASIYGNENAYELRLENFIIKYDYKYRYKIKLMASENSNVFRRPTVKEKLANNYGLDNFPLPENKTIMSYYFGGFTNQFLENDYEAENHETEGLFITIKDLSLEDISKFFSDLETYGAVKYDEVKDKFLFRHMIYSKGNANIDMIIDKTSSAETLSINMWVYNGALILPKLIKDELKEKISAWFNVENFLKLTGTYDADYTVYELRSYANHFFNEDSPLYCVTIDTKEKITDQYNRTLVQEMKYKQCKGDNNKPYSYKTRGQNHAVFEKDGVYIDVATYHTSDYTYTNHDDFEYRMEVLIYTGAPLSVQTYSNLDVLSEKYEEIDPSLGYHPELPSDAKVEVWYDMHDFKIAPVAYGYGNRDEAFVYTSQVEEAYSAVKQSLIDAGYKMTVERTYSASFSITKNGNSYYVFLLKEPDKGYLRVMNDVGGMSFMK